MNIFPTAVFLGVARVTGHYYPVFAGEAGWLPGKWRKTKKIKDDDREAFDEIYSGVAAMCENLELAASTATVKKMRETLARKNSTYGDFFGLGEELYGRLHDEMSSRQLLVLTLKEAQYFENPRSGWEEVIARFPDSAGDVEEAHKCFALSRYAAAVFHSVQIIEIGLIELGQMLGDQDPLTGWTSITNALGRIIEAKHTDRTSFQQTHFYFFEQLHGTIVGLKNAWRNKVSHAEGRLTVMTADFSSDVAEEILFATRAFMRRLATEMPASGEQTS